ncbi:MAG: hypothetical protein LLG04_09540 [Parachlamydia sp.]|nr:hypothetical protein [Parachlamydia sp.]
MKTNSVAAALDPINWHNGVMQAIKSENEIKRGFGGVIFIKMPLQLSLKCLAVATGVGALARELFVLISKSALCAVKMVTHPVRAIKSARPDHDKLPGLASCGTTARRVCGQALGILTSMLGAVFIYKGAEFNVRAQKNLGNMPETKNIPKVAPQKDVSPAAKAGEAARHAADLVEKLGGGESQAGASKEVMAYLSIDPGNGAKPIVAGFPTRQVRNGHAMVASIPLGQSGTAYLSLVPIHGAKARTNQFPRKVSVVKATRQPRIHTSPKTPPDISAPKPAQKPPEPSPAAPKQKATPKTPPKLMGGAAAGLADQVAAAARNRVLKPVQRPVANGVAPVPPPLPPLPTLAG